MFHLRTGFYGSSLPVHVWSGLLLSTVFSFPGLIICRANITEWEPGFRKGVVTDLTLVKETTGFAGS